MKYVSIAYWRDLQDGHTYDVGNVFPHDGREIPEKRIAELMSPQNKAGFAVIKAANEPNEGKPVVKAEEPKKPVSVAKKTTDEAEEEPKQKKTGRPRKKAE